MPKYKVCPKCQKPNDASFFICKYCATSIEKVSAFEAEDITSFPNAFSQKIEETRKYKEAINCMMLTTGFDFQGYNIIEYCDVIFDELFVGMGLFKSFAASIDNMGAALFGNEANVMGDKLNEVKRSLRDRIKLKAAKIGANALIGIDFESSKVGDLIMVSMTATAVKIEKIQ